MSTQEAPPLMPTLSSSSYQMKWSRLADLPAPMYYAHIAVQDKKVYVAGGNSLFDDAEHQVYVYDINTDHWNQLPPSGHHRGIPHIVGGRLTIIGGSLSATKRITNKVSTYDETTCTWTSYYPDLLSVRESPGVVTHFKHVIVAGGVIGTNESTDALLVQDDIEILNWIENSHWQRASIHLPLPMWTFEPIISDGHLVIVGYHTVEMIRMKDAFRISVAAILRLGAPQQQETREKWITMAEATHWSTALVPSSSPPVVVGGCDKSGTIVTSDVKMYDDSSRSWKKVASLPSARSAVTVAAVNNNAIIVISGCTIGNTAIKAGSSSLTTVELGQSMQSKPILIKF